MSDIGTRRLMAVGLVLVVAWGAGRAQQAPLTDAERARRDADSPMRWIKLHADAPAQAPAASPVSAKASTPQRGRAGAAANKSTASAAASSPAASTVGAASPAIAASAPAPAPLASEAAAPKSSARADLSPIRRVEPQWLPELMSTLRRGRVDVRFTVAADGSVASADIAESSNPKLDAAALAAMRQWRFATLASPLSARLEFGFDLDRDSAAPTESELIAIDQAEPQWDARQMQSLRKGRVQVRFDVGTDGQIVRAEVVSSSDAQLTPLALAAIRRWRFQPIDKVRSASIEFGFDLDK